MDIVEIVLLATGGIIFILSFLIPGKKGIASAASEKLVREQVRDMVNQELDQVRGRIDIAVDDAAAHAADKTERSLERLSNEKIMAVNEYSDTVLAQIHKDHEEAMFLYDMLNNKHDSMKRTLSEINQALSEVNRAVKSAEEAASNLQRELTQPEAQEEAPAWQEEVLPVREPETAEDEEEMEKLNSNDRILALYRQGKSSVDIAKTLGLGVGEVKLVIDLFTGTPAR
jgi:phage-related tail protein